MTKKERMKHIYILVLLIIWPSLNSAYSQNFAGGSGTESDPYQVETAAHLDEVRNYPNAYFIQIEDIDLQGTNWDPIGKRSPISTRFSGKYNGNNHIVKNLYINRLINYIGLFGYTTNTAEIKYLGVIDINVTGDFFVGGVVGENAGSIIYCFSTGSVNGTFEIGGLVGKNSGYLINCYSDVAVEGEEAVGGITGGNYRDIEFSYSVGRVLGEYFPGGLVGYSEGGTVSNSYWDTQSSGQSNSDGGFPRTTAQMKTQGTFVGWDFVDTWVMASTYNNGYPSFQWQVGYIWEGSSTAWGSGANWNVGSVPGASASVVIPGTAGNFPVLSDNRTVNNVEIQSGASLTVGTTGQFTIIGNITNDAGTGGFVVESDISSTGSVILNNAVAGTVKRHATGSQWHIVSSPVSGQGINSFLTNSANNIPYNSTNDLYAMTEYGESIHGDAGGWASYFTSSTGGNLLPGKGYLVGPKSGGAALEFKGTPAHSSMSISIPRGAFGWHAVGNPFPSAIGITINAASAENFLAVNSDEIEGGAFQAIYLYNPASKDYEPVNNSSAQAYVQPGQGFMVKAPSGGGTISFTTGMRVHNQATGFLKKSGGSSWPVIRLRTVSGDHNASTLITFNSNMTRGLDPSYDAGQYTTKPEFKVYTRLADGSSEINFAIQALPDYGFDDMVIPVGFDFKDGGKVTFSASELQLPDGAASIFEDRVLNLFTNLAEKNYVVDLEPGSSGTGRFFIHTDITITGTERIEPAVIDKLRMYSSGKEIFIVGPVDMNSMAAVYDLTGRQLKLVKLSGADRNSFRVDELERGIYIIRVTGGKINQGVKVFIE
jgi:hypothetical protein